MNNIVGETPSKYQNMGFNDLNRDHKLCILLTFENDFGNLSEIDKSSKYEKVSYWVHDFKKTKLFDLIAAIGRFAC